MYSIFRDVILRGGYNLDGLIEKLNKAHSEGKITEDQRAELLVLIANTKHDARDSVIAIQKSLGLYEEEEE